MKCAAFIILACTLWGANAFPYHYYGNRDTLSYGSRNDGLALSRYHTLHNNPRLHSQNYQASRFYQPDRRRQATLEETYAPQQNEGFYPQITEEFLTPKPTEIAELLTEKVEIPTTVKAVLPELVEPEIEEVEHPKETKESKKITPESKKNITKNKQIKRPADEEDEEEEEEEEYASKMPKGAFFPMFFGWGGSRSSGSASNGATAIANAFSTGRKGVATSHATAYGPPRPEYRSN